MKKTALLFTSFYLLQGAPAQTITSAVPGYISYQGRALDANGANVGATTPVNRTVIFRVWDHPSNVLAANLLYSETQTVTISGGEFSVLIGQGVATSGTAFTYSETTKGVPTVTIGSLAVFGGATRYLGVTIDDGTSAVDNEISPRQQIVSSAYALRAKYAEQLGANGNAALTALDSGNIGIGNTNPPSLFTITGANTSTTTSTPQLLLTDSADATKRLRIGVDSTGTGTGFIQAYKESTGAQNLLLNPNGGFVGIGTASPSVALSVSGAITATGAITGASLNTAGTLTATGAITGGSLSTAGAITGTGVGITGAITATGNIMTSSGNVGIGMTAPGFPLNFANTLGDKISLYFASGNSYGLGVQNNLLQIHTDNSSGDVGFGYGSSAAMTETMRIKGTGNVGIGTSSPGYKLDVNGTIHATQLNLDGSILMNDSQLIYGRNLAGGYEPTFWPRASNGTYINYGTSGFYIRNNASTNTMSMLDNGNVMIGTVTADARLNVGAINVSTYMNGYLDTNGGQSGDSTVVRALSIKADGLIIAPLVGVNSDLRIKTDLHATDSVKDLATLMGIEVTDYHLKDKIAHGSSPQKKVIAQQVEKVYPQAVMAQKGVVPDIFKKAAVKDGWVMLATDLKAGERVRLISSSGETLEEVLEVRRDAFRTSLKAADDKTFVYGREVPDFRSVDYDAIAMLNVSATQELARELKSVQDENAALRRALAAKDVSVEARLIALEQRLTKGGAPAAVAIKTARSTP